MVGGAVGGRELVLRLPGAPVPLPGASQWRLQGSGRTSITTISQQDGRASIGLELRKGKERGVARVNTLDRMAMCTLVPEGRSLFTWNKRPSPMNLLYQGRKGTCGTKPNR